MLALIAAAMIISNDSCKTEREFEATTADGNVLAAELVHIGRHRRPTVVLISGAGPHTRNYSTDTGSWPGGNRAFDLLTTALVRTGYSVVRFDERGTGRSTGEYAGVATTASLADDVETLIEATRRLPEVDGSRIILLGHSEGGAIATLVASRDPSISGLVLLASPAWKGSRIIESQHRWQIANGNWTNRHSTLEERAAVLAMQHADRMANDQWYQFFLEYDPLPATRRVRVPVLILHGESDWKVTAEQAHELAAAARSVENDRVTPIILPNHSHSLGALDADGHEGSFSNAVVRELLQWMQQEQPTRLRADGCNASRASQRKSHSY